MQPTKTAATYRVDTADRAKTTWKRLADGIPTRAQAERCARGLLAQGYGAVARITKQDIDVRYYGIFEPVPYWVPVDDLPAEAFEGGVTVEVPVEECVREIWR